jgi:hypothetical protein
MLKLCDKLKLLPPLAAFFLLLMAAGCNQDSIFYYISGEAAPTTALIKGSPSKIVSATIGGTEKLYIANGRVWEYDTTSAGWSRIAGPGGFVADVAATDSALYALTIADTVTRVWKYDGTSWAEKPLDPPADYGFIQTIFGSGDVLFAAGAKGSGTSYSYAILSSRADQRFKVLQETGKAVPSGAGKAGGDYYLAARGKDGGGIYKVDAGLAGGVTPITVSDNTTEAGNPVPVPSDMTGFLQVTTPAEAIIGISKDGRIVYIADSKLEVAEASRGRNYTGALALMDSPAPHDGYDKLLLLGYEHESALYTHGYKELQFNSSVGPHHKDTILQDPGKTPSSVEESQQYESSLKRYPVTALWVLPPSSVLAATSNEGLYSYRNRGDEDWQWNHEE